MANEAPTIPYLERVKIQAEVLVPLVQALQAELGEERANRIVREALGGAMRKAAEEMVKDAPGTTLEKVEGVVPVFSAGGAIDVSLVEKSPDALGFDVTGCRYAKFYRELGVPELGFLLVCSLDFPMAEGLGPDLELHRTQTIMQGATHCDFRFRLKKTAAGSGT